MQRRQVFSYVLLFGPALAFASGCSATIIGPDAADTSTSAADGSVRDDADDVSITPDAPADVTPLDALDVALDDAADVDAADAAPLPPRDAGTVDAGPSIDPRFEVDMTYVTANIGRTYSTQADVAAVFDHVRDVVGAMSGPRFIGWQEIGEGDPCGATCEIDEINRHFTTAAGWETERPAGTRPDGGTERVKVPITSKGAGGSTAVRAVFASPGWAGVSPTRFVTVVYYAAHNVSVIDTHFIAGAWSCASDVAQRRDYWRRAWTTLREQVDNEFDRGRNVIVTGDLNRARAESSCNPAWDPTTLHAGARVIGGTGIDYIFAVPAAGWSFVYARRADGTVNRGTIRLGIDGHESHWVEGHFAHP